MCHRFFLKFIEFEIAEEDTNDWCQLIIPFHTQFIFAMESLF